MSDYVEKLKDPRWQRKRLEIMQRDGFRCREWLNAIEIEVRGRADER